MLEIEKKYLLEKMPFLAYSENYHIFQMYFKDSIGQFRIRKKTNLRTGNVTYFITRKKKISNGIYDEDEKKLTNKEFEKYLNIFQNKQNNNLISPISYIQKLRNEYIDVTNGLKYEIDSIIHRNRIIFYCEIEFDNEEYFNLFETNMLLSVVQKVLIKDVTGEKEHSNYDLSTKTILL